MFITFEGLDFSGKSTQVQLLQERLQREGHNVLVLREPGGTVVGEKIRSILLDAENTQLTEASELFLFEASRSQLVAEVIRPALAQGTIVICDRYYDSTTAYQGYGRGIPLDMISAMNVFASDHLVPTLTFFLDIPLEEIERRIKKANATKDRMELNEREFYERVRNGYLAIAQSERRFSILNGMLSVEEIHSRIWNEIEHQLQCTLTKQNVVKEL
ncbi:MAG TPA: dTMP kinase [Bacteroidota bacterium]|nr:dTMP kinase [Bacteroidota bacterium]